MKHFISILSVLILLTSCKNTTDANKTAEANSQAIADSIAQVAAEAAKQAALPAEVDLTGLSAKSQIQDGCGYDAFIKLPRITAADREAMQLNKITLNGTSFSKVSNKELAKGKVIFQSEACRLETFFWIVPDHSTSEILVSYNAQGDKVDVLQIGYIHNYGGDRNFAKLTGSKIVYGSSTYELGKDLKFKKAKKGAK